MLSFASALLLLLCIAASSVRCQPNGYDYADYDSELQQDSNYIENGLSPGSKEENNNDAFGLRSVAQGSALQAEIAAVSQHAAGKRAAYLAQNTLARAAVQASETAHVALAGKLALVERLKQQSIEAHQQLHSELQHLQLTKRSVKAAHESVRQALAHIIALNTALNSAQDGARHAHQAAAEATAELTSQTAMVKTARIHYESISRKLHSAQIDLEATEAAARDAGAAAREAQSNAAATNADAENHAFDLKAKEQQLYGY